MDHNPYPSTPRLVKVPLHMLRCKELSVSLKTNQTSLSEFVPLHGDLSRDTLGDAIQSLREAIRLNPKKNYHKLLAQALTYDPENSELRQKLGENHRGSTLGGIKKIFGREKD